jgi:HK97 family phage prohead protease
MEHLSVKAVATATELDEFTAIAATYDIDRVKDQIAPGAFERTIARWQASGKKLPVHWKGRGRHHRRDRPGRDARDPDEGLCVEGKLDLQHSEVAREAWRSMKNNAVSLSFGYLVTKTRKRRDGIQDLLEFDRHRLDTIMDGVPGHDPAAAAPSARSSAGSGTGSGWSC